VQTTPERVQQWVIAIVVLRTMAKKAVTALLDEIA
jgi:hypothetical protein